jgi:hypothetical protein
MLLGVGDGFPTHVTRAAAAPAQYGDTTSEEEATIGQALSHLLAKVFLRVTATRNVQPLTAALRTQNEEQPPDVTGVCTHGRKESNGCADGRKLCALRHLGGASLPRYIRLLKDPETQGLSTTLFQAGDVLIGSAQVWVRQVKAEAEIAALTPNGSRPQLSRAQAARDAAATERARQWELAQRLILQATALSAESTDR